MKLISEALEDVKFLAEEDDNGKKNYKIKGIFMQGNIKNRNGRVYPTEVLEKEIKRYSDKFIANNSYQDLQVYRFKKASELRKSILKINIDIQIPFLFKII